jgi:hypothetical protein
LEVRHEVLVRLDGDDAASLRPDLLEQREQELAPLGRLRLDLRELREVIEQRLGAVDAGVGGGCAEALDLLLQCRRGARVRSRSSLADQQRRCSGFIASLIVEAVRDSSRLRQRLR